MPSPPVRRGLSLLELSVVLVILIALAGVVVPLTSQNIENAERHVSEESCRRLEGAIRAYAQDHLGLLPGQVPNDDDSPFLNINLLFDEPTEAGYPTANDFEKVEDLYSANVAKWNGPYIDLQFLRVGTPRKGSDDQYLLRSAYRPNTDTLTQANAYSFPGFIYIKATANGPETFRISFYLTPINDIENPDVTSRVHFFDISKAPSFTQAIAP